MCSRPSEPQPVTEHEKVQELIRLKDQAPVVIDPSATALLVIDVQRYFVRPEYPLGQLAERLVPGVTTGYFARVASTVVPNIARLQAAFRAMGSPIFYTACGSYRADGRDLPGWLRDFDQLGLAVLGRRIWPPAHDPSWQIDEGVAPLPGEVVLTKPSSGPLASTALEPILRNMGVTSLVVAGLLTDVCVTQAARELADRGFQVAIAEDACTTLSEEMHRAALLAFGLAFGRVRPTAEIAQLVAAASPRLEEPTLVT